MGYIRKRGENSWSITINAGTDPVTGKRKRIYKSIKGTKTEAKKVMQEIEYKLKNGSYIEPSDLTLRELMHRWYKRLCRDQSSTLYPRILSDYNQFSHNSPLRQC